MRFYFGNKQTSFDPALFKHSESITLFEPFKTITCKFGINDLLFLHQIHGNGGTIITCYEQLANFQPFSIDGDFLITNLSNIGLAIATADCLPILMYDSVNKVIAAIHAGWQGTIVGVSTQAIKQMCAIFKTKVEHIQIYFGPSAGSCCYEVGPEFNDKIPQQFASALIKKDDKWFLNLAHINRMQLSELGIPESNFNTMHNHCTIENLNYCSYRRDNKSPLRQMSIIALR